MRRGIVGVIIGFAALGAPVLVWAASSENYQVTDELNAGGGFSAGTEYRSIDSVNYSGSSLFDFDRMQAGSPGAQPPAQPGSEQPPQALTVNPPQESAGNLTTAPIQLPGTLRRVSDAFVGVVGPLREWVADLVAELAALPTYATLTAASATAVVLMAALPGLLGGVGGAMVGGGMPVAAFAGAVPSTMQWVNWLMGWPRRRRGYGRVFVSATGKPLAGATVRLIAENVVGFSAGKLVGITTTDVNGLYQFSVASGVYRIEVVADGYEFPSKYAVASYVGGNVEADQHGHIAVDVGLDAHSVVVPIAARASEQLVRSLRVVRLPLLVIGTVCSIGFLIRRTTFVDLIVALMYVALWAQERAVFAGRGKVGRVMSGRNPIPASVVRIYGHDGLIATRVTDATGAFSIFVPKGECRVDVEKAGAAPLSTVVRQRHPGEIAATLHLRPVAAL